MDLSGSWDNDMVANMTCGIGEITLYLPEETGVIVKTSGILGGITARDFKRNNKVYTNRQYGKTEHTLFLNIEGGIGHINLRQR